MAAAALEAGQHRDRAGLERFSAKWIQFAIKKRGKQRRESIPFKWKRL
jgi:hypothetical protein